MQSLADALGLNEQHLDDYPELTVRDFCRGVLESREYRQSVKDRVALGTLPPAVECKMYDYAYGKPVDRIEHTGKDGGAIVTRVERVIVHAHDEMVDLDMAPHKEATTH